MLKYIGNINQARLILSILLILSFTKATDTNLIIHLLTCDLKNSYLSKFAISNINNNLAADLNKDTILVLSIINWEEESSNPDSFTRMDLIEYENQFGLLNDFKLWKYTATEGLDVLLFLSLPSYNSFTLTAQLIRKEPYNIEIQNLNTSITLGITYKNILSLEFTLLNLSRNPNWSSNPVSETTKFFRTINSGFATTLGRPHFLFLSGHFNSKAKYIPDHEEDAILNEGSQPSPTNVSFSQRTVLKLKEGNKHHFQRKFQKFVEETPKEPEDIFWRTFFLNFKKYDMFSSGSVRGFDANHFMEWIPNTPPNFPQPLDFFTYEDVNYEVPTYLYRTFFRSILEFDIFDRIKITDYYTQKLSQFKSNLEGNNNNNSDNGESGLVIFSLFRAEIATNRLGRGKEISEYIQSLKRIEIIIKFERWVTKRLVSKKVSFPSHFNFYILSGNLKVEVDFEIMDVKEYEAKKRETRLVLSEEVFNIWLDEDLGILCLGMVFNKIRSKEESLEELVRGSVCFSFDSVDLSNVERDEKSRWLKTAGLFEYATMQKIGEVTLNIHDG